MRTKLSSIFYPLTMSQNLKLLRRAAGLNQTELAEALRCSQGSISKLERDELPLTTFQLMCIRDFFGISADDFLDSRIDFFAIAYRFSNHSFSMEKYFPVTEKQAA